MPKSREQKTGVQSFTAMWCDGAARAVQYAIRAPGGSHGGSGCLRGAQPVGPACVAGEGARAGHPRHALRRQSSAHLASLWRRGASLPRQPYRRYRFALGGGSASSPASRTVLATSDVVAMSTVVALLFCASFLAQILLTPLPIEHSTDAFSLPDSGLPPPAVSLLPPDKLLPFMIPFRGGSGALCGGAASAANTRYPLHQYWTSLRSMKTGHSDFKPTHYGKSGMRVRLHEAGLVMGTALQMVSRPGQLGGPRGQRWGGRRQRQWQPHGSDARRLPAAT